MFFKEEKLTGNVLIQIFLRIKILITGRNLLTMILWLSSYPKNEIKKIIKFLNQF